MVKFSKKIYHGRHTLLLLLVFTFEYNKRKMEIFRLRVYSLGPGALSRARPDKERTMLLGDPEITENIYCKSRNLPNKDTQYCSTDLR